MEPRDDHVVRRRAACQTDDRAAACLRFARPRLRPAVGAELDELEWVFDRCRLLLLGAGDWVPVRIHGAGWWSVGAGHPRRRVGAVRCDTSWQRCLARRFR